MKLKYKVLNKGYDFLTEDELLDVLLKSRGVENPKKLLNLNENVIHDGMLLKNMETGLKLLHKHMLKAKEEEVKIHIIVDSDNDGLASASLIYNYIEKLMKKENLLIKMTYSLHEGKQHGIILKEIENYDFDLLIVPDAGSNDIKECKIIKNNNKDILILDHHNFDNNNPYAVVINCMDGQYPNTTLSGTGVVYKFCREYDKYYEYDFANNFLEIVALGNIGDLMDLRNYETRYLTLLGLQQFGENNLFLKELMEKQAFSMKNKATITSVGWYICPLLNAVIRSGTMEEKIDVFKALIGVKEEREYKPRKTKKNPNPKIELQTLQQYMARICTNIKGRQDREVKKDVDKIIKKIEDKKLNDNRILMVECTDILDSKFTGLVANKLTSKYKRPVILLREREEGVFGGSIRNYRLSSIVNLKKFLEEINTFNSLDGHNNAMGFSIDIDNLIPTRDKTNKILKDVPIEDTYKVDYEIPIGRLKTKHINQVGQWEDIWGNMLDEPLFAITDIYIPVEEIKLLGAKKNIIRFNKKIGSNDITFIKFFANTDVYNKMTLKQSQGLNTKKVKRVKMNVIGKFKINRWQGNEYPQIEIVDFDSVENKDFIF